MENKHNRRALDAANSVFHKAEAGVLPSELAIVAFFVVLLVIALAYGT